MVYWLLLLKLGMNTMEKIITKPIQSTIKMRKEKPVENLKTQRRCSIDRLETLEKIMNLQDGTGIRKAFFIVFRARIMNTIGMGLRNLDIPGLRMFLLNLEGICLKEIYDDNNRR